MYLEQTGSLSKNPLGCVPEIYTPKSPMKLTCQTENEVI